MAVRRNRGRRNPMRGKTKRIILAGGAVAALVWFSKQGQQRDDSPVSGVVSGAVRPLPQPITGPPVPLPMAQDIPLDIRTGVMIQQWSWWVSHVAAQGQTADDFHAWQRENGLA